MPLLCALTVIYRAQIGYWTVGKANCRCEDSKFWPYMDKYEAQWGYVLKAIDWANQRGMGVLIDLHGAQGRVETGRGRDSRDLLTVFLSQFRSQNTWGEPSVDQARNLSY